MKKLLTKLNKTSLIISIFAVLIVITVPLYDKVTDKYLNESLKQAAVTYAITRGINAAVSSLQESSVGIEILGVEGDLAIGQILDPVNDATERFSDLLTLSLWTLGSEKVIYELSKLPAFTILILLLALLNLIYNSKFLKQLLLIFIIIRMFLPFTSIISNYLNKYYFIPQINQAEKILKPYDNYEKSLSENNTEDDGTWSSVSQTIKSVKDSFVNIRNEIDYYTSHASEIVNAFIKLATLYLSQLLLNILIFPLFIVFLIKNTKLE